MALSFKGLTELMRKSKLNIDTLPSGKFVIFINRRQNAFKCLINNQFMVYHKTPGPRFPLEAIQHFPQFFNGTTIDFNRAAEKVISEKMFTHKIKKPRG